MMPPGGGTKVRRHLVLSEFLWDALKVEARRRGMRLSQLTQEMVLGGLRAAGLVTPPELSGPGRLQRNGQRYYCRLSVDRALWQIMAQVAGELGCSVPEAIRRHLQATIHARTTWRDPLPSGLIPAAVSGPLPSVPRQTGGFPNDPADDAHVATRLPILDLEE